MEFVGGDGFLCFGDECQEVLGEEFAVQGIRALFHEILGLQAMDSLDGDVRVVGRLGWNGEDEGGGERVAIVVLGLSQEEAVVGYEGVVGQEKATDCDGGEVVGFFEDGWAGVTTLAWTGANEEAGDVAFDELLVEVDEEVAEGFEGATLLA